VKPIRELEREANFRPFEGAARIFIVEDAHYMNEQAANALLKTLEEPAPTSHLILTATNPTALAATIRSRCQVVRFAPIPAAEVEHFLSYKRNVSAEDAALLAHTSGGSLGRAINCDADDYRERRRAMLQILKALTISGNRVQLLHSAEELAAVKDRGDYEENLNVLESLIHDSWALALRRPAETIANYDVLIDLQRIAEELSSKRAES